MRKLYFSFLSLLLISHVTQAQNDTLQQKDLLDWSLEELMNVQVVSASKKSENLFDAPLSASVLTREEIQKAGVTSIMEALRLVPGLIVREETNGNYDIHVRGLDNVPPNSFPTFSANTTTLVMIDNRPVYNYMQGGTFWETLPIDLNDVEKIEVVRGPSATTYGPNAVSGVINIITRKLDKKGWSTQANAQYGSLKTTIANASVGYQFSNKLSMILSGNYQGRGREVAYYHPNQDRYYNTPDSLTYPNKDVKAPQSFPHPDRSMDKYAGNLFLDYHPNEKVQLSLSSGLQNSEVQNAYGAYSTISSLTTAQSQTGYADLKANVYGFNTQVSFLKGRQDPSLGFTGSTIDFHTLDAIMEYDMKVLDRLSIKPGLTYRSAVYDDTPYWNASKKEGFLSARRQLDTYAGSLRIDYQTLDGKLRMVGGARLDKFSHPNQGFLSYQVAANFKASSNHLFRAVASRAYRSASINDTYLDVYARVPMYDPGLPKGSYMEVYVLGNKNLNMVKSEMLELGYRGKLADNLSVDVEAYYTMTKDYTNIIFGPSTVTAGNPMVFKTLMTIENIPLSAHQLGTSLSVNYVLKRLQIKPFVTLQTTSLHDYSKYANFPNAAPQSLNDFNPQQNNIYSGLGTTTSHQFTPHFYGGAFINYQLTSRLNLNLNSYYYSAQTFYHKDNLTYNDGRRGIQQIDPKLILNAKLSYSPTQSFSVFVSGKNLFNNDSREYYKTDQIGALFLTGISLKY
jgi:iron complex outermembrane recepter protein